MMWVRTYSKLYENVRKEQVWAVWSDVNNWPKWDKELDYCEMTEPFMEGSHFYLKPKGGPRIKMILSQVIENKRFTDYCNFFLAKMYDLHILEETSEGVRITNTITVIGPLSFLWVKLVGQNVVNSIPEQIELLVDFARSK